MIVCTTSFILLTIVLFTLSNPGASGGPATERVLSDQANTIGMLMAVFYVIPLVLSCAYPMYGEHCCTATKDEEVPDSEEKIQETGKVDYVVLVSAILHWGVIGVFIMFYLYLAVSHSLDVQEDWEVVFEGNATKNPPPPLETNASQ